MTATWRASVALGALDPKDLAQLLFEQVCPVEGAVGVGDRRETGALLVRQLCRVLAHRPRRVPIADPREGHGAHPYSALIAHRWSRHRNVCKSRPSATAFDACTVPEPHTSCPPSTAAPPLIATCGHSIATREEAQDRGVDNVRSLEKSQVASVGNLQVASVRQHIGHLGTQMWGAQEVVSESDH